MMTIEEMNKLRISFGLTYQQICFASGVPISTVQKILGRVTKNPRMESMERLDMALRPYQRRLAAEQAAQDQQENYADVVKRNVGETVPFAASQPAAIHDANDTNAANKADTDLTHKANTGTTHKADTDTAHKTDTNTTHKADILYETGMEHEADMVHETGAVYGSGNGILRENHGFYGTNESSARALPHVYTVTDREALPPERRTELIDGVLYDMASPRISHQVVEMHIYNQIWDCVRTHKTNCMVFIAPTDVQIDRDEYTMVVPDIFIVCDRSKITEKNIQGAPDFILEVLSPSNQHVDRSVKLEKYCSSGVREYWIVDAKREKVIVYHEIPEETDEEKTSGQMKPAPSGTVWEQERADENQRDAHPRHMYYDVTTYTFTDKIPIWISDGKCVIDMNEVRDALAELA